MNLRLSNKEMLSSRYSITSSSWAGRRLGPRLLPNGQSSNKTFPTISSRVIAFHSTSKWKAHFEASKSTNKLMIIEFTALWCVPCRYLDPMMNEFAAKYTDAEFIKIDVDELMGVSSTFGVQTLPTVLLIKKGSVVDKVTGVRKEELEKKIEKQKAYNYRQ